MCEAPKESKEKAAPQFLDLLSGDDIEGYNNLKEQLSSPHCRNQRNKRLENFSEMLNTIKAYAVRGDENDWKRCLVCGVVWLTSGIAINTRQLRILINKCKSSINGSLHRMGYSTVMSRGDTSSQLVDMIPILRNNFSELRQWTVRQTNVSTPQPMIARYQPMVAPLSATPMPFSGIPMSISLPQTSQIVPEDDTDFFGDALALPLMDWTNPPSGDMPPRDDDDPFDLGF